MEAVLLVVQETWAIIAFKVAAENSLVQVDVSGVGVGTTIAGITALDGHAIDKAECCCAVTRGACGLINALRHADLVNNI